MNKAEILVQLTQVIDRLKREHGVEELHLFGSFARGEASSDSDVDLLVNFSRPVSMFDFVRLKMELEKVLERRVDLVTRDAIKPKLWKEISKDLERAA